MPSFRASRSKSGWRRRVFSVVVRVTLGLVGFIGMVLLRPNLIAGLLGHEMAGHISGHFREPHHRVHDLTFSFIFGTSVVGILGQLRRPSENVAGQLMALTPWVVLMLIFAVTNKWVFAPAPILGALTLVAAILHPTGRNFFGSFSVSRVNRVMLALVIIAAVPLLAFAFTNIGLQRTVTNEHAALGHYEFMAAFSFIVIGVGVLASLRPDGWRLTAWVAGLLPALLGVASLVFPRVDSSLGLPWALAAIAWGIAFVAAAELTRDAEGPTRRTPVGITARMKNPAWLLLLLVPLVVFAREPRAPYVGRREREIKALSADQVNAYLEGKGAELALAAELNHYPGPLHALELAGPLQLTAAQKTQTEDVRAALLDEVKRLGRLIVEKEKELDGLFAAGKIEEDQLRTVVREISRLQGELRIAHLRRHLETKRILTPEQVKRYEELRGYALAGAGHEGRTHRKE